MADKMSWTDLRKTLASRAGVSEKDAGAFLSAFCGQLVEALKSEKQVKINGLGIFRLQAVAPRRSVDISTGEEIVIEGYNKIVYAPEAGLKELVEASPVSGERLPVTGDGLRDGIDPIKKLGEQAEEIVDILGDLGEGERLPAADKVEGMNVEGVKEPEADKVEGVKEPEPEVQPFVYVPGAPPVKSEQQIKKEKEEKEKRVQSTENRVQKEGEHSVCRLLIYLLICLIVFLLLFFGAYFFFRGKVSSWIEQLLQKPETEQVVPADTIVAPEEADQETIPSDAYDSQESLIPEGELSQAQILAEFLLASGEEDEMEITSARSQELEYAGWIKVEPIREGSRLTLIALRYYGSKVYWPYLYDTNRDRFSDPNIIDAGTPIRIPRLTVIQLDTTNAQTRANLERLRKQAEAQMR